MKRGRIASIVVTPVLAVVLAASALTGCVPPTGPVAVTLTIDASSFLGATNARIRGFTHNEGAVSDVAALHPRVVRIDARPQNVAPSPDSFDLTNLLGQVAAVRAIGAEPLVILWGTPPWLAAAGNADPITRPPADYDRWQQLMERIIEGLATAPQPATWFEVWNEPDGPTFWSGSTDQFTALALRTHAAAAAVQARTGVALHTGGPAATFPGAAVTEAYLYAVHAAGYVPAFVSWHQYPNVLFGPDGPEGVGQPFYPELAGRNPFLTPKAYADAVRDTRQLVAGLFGPAAAGIELGITEWNLSAGGLDLRNETNEGAAFTAAAFTVFEEAGLDFAMIYRSVGSNRPGDWGVVDGSGQRAPRWEVFAAFDQTDGQRVAVAGADPATGLWARATASPGRTDVIVSAFGANPFTTFDRDVTLAGLPPGATVRGADAAHPAFTIVTATEGAGGLAFTLPAQSVAWVTVH